MREVMLVFTLDELAEVIQHGAIISLTTEQRIAFDGLRLVGVTGEDGGTVALRYLSTEAATV